MIVAVSATKPGLDAKVDDRFGRCSCFVIVDPQTMEVESLDNAGVAAPGGAGVAAAQTLADKGVQVVLTGNCGPKAYQVLTAAEIQVITGVAGTVSDAIADYKVRQLQPGAAPGE